MESSKWIIQEIYDMFLKEFVYEYKCSECKATERTLDRKSWKFCPNCGADMRGEK